MIEDILKDVTEIDAVEGVYLASNRGEILDARGLSFDMDALKELSRRLLSISAFYATLGKKVTELEFYWARNFITCKVSDHFMVVAFSHSTQVHSLLRITLNVTMSKLLENKKFNKWVKSHLADRTYIIKKCEWTEAEEKLLAKLK